jgi:hypothetical protein
VALDLVESHQFATDFLLPSEVGQGLGVPTLKAFVEQKLKIQNKLKNHMVWIYS